MDLLLGGGAVGGSSRPPLSALNDDGGSGGGGLGSGGSAAVAARFKKRRRAHVKIPPAALLDPVRGTAGLSTAAAAAAQVGAARYGTAPGTEVARLGLVLDAYAGWAAGLRPGGEPPPLRGGGGGWGAGPSPLVALLAELGPLAKTRTVAAAIDLARVDGLAALGGGAGGVRGRRASPPTAPPRAG
ncbi:hypothetical protein MMPV_007235 [Pyropia vietnamensis]